MCADESWLGDSVEDALDDPEFDWECFSVPSETTEEREQIENLQGVWSIYRYNLELQKSAVTAECRPQHRPEFSIEQPHHKQNPPTSPEIPRRWLHFTIVEQLGRGMQGGVFRARDENLKKDVALKLRPVRVSASPRSLKREGRLLAQLARHDNIVTVYGLDEADGFVGIWMEYLDGVSLEEEMATHKAMGPEDAARIVRDLCRGLAAAHRAGILHRDIKASNVMRIVGGRVVLTDFGVSATQVEMNDAASGEVHGTPIYMAPESLLSGTYSKASDTYSLGVLLYYLVTGRYPIEARTVGELKERHRSGALQRVRSMRDDLPEAFAEIVDRAVAPDPGSRFESAQELQQALDCFVRRESIQSTARRPRIGWRVAIGLISVLVTGTALVIAFRDPQDPGPYSVLASLHRHAPLPHAALRQGDSVTVGDKLYLDFEATVPLWVYVISHDDSGNVFLHFPLSGLGWELTNPLPGSVQHKLPGKFDDEQRAWVVTSSGGRERFLIVASPERLRDLEQRIAAATTDQEVGLLAGMGTADPTTAVLLRGIGGLSELHLEGKGQRRSDLNALYSLADTLRSVRESTYGTWARRIELSNPPQAGQREP